MKKINTLATLFLAALFMHSCSSEPKLITYEQIAEVVKGKQLSDISIDASGDLTYDFPSSIRIQYVDNSTTYSQKLNSEGLSEPKKERPLNEKLYYTATWEELPDVDVDVAFTNAINYIKKESDDEFEYYTISSISIRPTKNWKKEKSVTQEITIQATKKGEESEYKFSHKKVSTTKNFYEFTFNILENSEVEFKK
ncbi:MAG: hypothetical protein ABJD66_14670 [Cellulophaga sp.]|uniref:hypothetical protein n=1 Tax=unclassified Cellulophaga TaxID=2634405 RepID=UPI0026E46855|nr:MULTISPECIES: hypothetical protein [unclassified Cellulophaga]MDO6490651.1 hypothetical protein [Cellulophaga sp. 2_MG-2023]MDO6494155.1 hypothetical protein [Cellulophaga sp. 3_MG-2023]